jgi:hypothetical protein
MIDESAASVVDDAATRLLAVGCADPEQVAAAVRLRCLWAVEELRSIGALARRDLEPHDVDDVPGAVTVAVAALARVATADGTDVVVAATVREVVERLRGT